MSPRISTIAYRLIKLVVHSKNRFIHLFKYKTENKIGRILITNSIGSFGLKVSYALLTFISTLIFTRLIGTQGYGTYAYVISIITLLSIFSTLGIEKLLVREIAIYKSTESWGLMKGIIRWSNRVVFLSSSVISVISGIVILNLNSIIEKPIFTGLLISLFCLPLISIRNVRLSILSGLDKIILGLLPEYVLFPALTILISCIAYVFFRPHIGSNIILIVHLISTIITFCVGSNFLISNLPREVYVAEPQLKSNIWFKNSMPMLLIGSMYLVNSQTDIIMIGTISGTYETGIYSVVYRLSDLIRLVLVSIGGAFAPTIAGLYASNQLSTLQLLVKKNSLVITTFATLLFILFVAFGKNILSIFGSNMIEGYQALLILSLGQLINSAMGSVGYLLTMTGHEMYLAKTMTITGLANIALNALLIPSLGETGAAISTSITVVMWNILLAIFVKLRLNINSTAFIFIK
jgi:O-antigen/teichoic acid export membrane protein